VTVNLRLPRYVIPKRLVSGHVAFYFNIPSYFKKLGCPVPNEPLGIDYDVACGKDGNGGRAAALNARGGPAAPGGDDGVVIVAAMRPARRPTSKLPPQSFCTTKNHSGRQEQVGVVGAIKRK
jgi:hypothetical protein